MASFVDTTIKVSSEGQIQIAPDGDVHVTWVEDGVSFTLILSMAEAKRLGAIREKIAATHREPVAS